MADQRRFASVPQPLGSRLDHGADQLGHARRRRARPGAEGEDVQEGQAGLLHQLDRVFEHRLGLRRETGDQVGAKGRVRAHRAHALDQRQGVGPTVPSLHALEDHVVAGLQ